MRQGQFGRRGITLDGAPVPDSRPGLELPGPDRPAHIAADGSFLGWRRFVVIVIVALIGFAWLEALFSGTALITPINSSVLWAMRGLGALVGLAVGVLLWSKIALEQSWWKATLVALFSPVLFAFLFDGIAWRVADWAAFGFSSQGFEVARYPVEAVSHGRKGRRDVIEIDPFDTGENAEIPIPDAQYDEIWLHHEGLCIAVQQRRNPAGAIEIRTDGQYTWREPAAADLTSCIGEGAVRTRTASGSNPWGKY